MGVVVPWSLTRESKSKRNGLYIELLEVLFKLIAKSFSPLLFMIQKCLIPNYELTNY